MKHVIIGGSAAGVTASEIIRKNDKKAEITLVSDESTPLYSRCLLTYLIAGTIDESKLYFKEKNFYTRNKIKTYLGVRAVSIDKKERNVILEDGKKISYDKLLIATGARPKTDDIPGADKNGVYTLRTIGDARAMIKHLDGVGRVAVLGGGLIGLRDAYALRQRGKDVTVIVKSPHVLSQMVDKDAAKIISCLFEKNGIRIMTGVAAKEITGRSSVESVVLDNGERLDCQLVVIGKGVKPNTELAKTCGLAVKDGIVADEFLRTSDRDIYAAGDVAQTVDIARQAQRVNALWPCAVEQGEIAAFNMVGDRKLYDGSLSMNSVDFFGIGSISMGITKPDEAEYEIELKISETAYKKLVFKGNHIVGMVFVGDIKSAGIISVLIKQRIDIRSVRHLLLEESFNYAKIMPLVKEFKDKFAQKEFQETVITYDRKVEGV